MCALVTGVQTCALPIWGDVIFEKFDPGSSLFGIARGQALVEVAPGVEVPIEQGSIFGEVGLISGRRRGATVRAGADSIMVEVSRTAALKLMSSNPPAKRAITRISTERQLLQMFGAGLTPADLADRKSTRLNSSH